MGVNKTQFMAYESVRRSGKTNMWDTVMVGNLSGLTREEILEVIKNYGKLAKKYLKK